MTEQDAVAAYLASLTNEELIASTNQAQIDLSAAAKDSPESEWHQSCFAGLILYSGEVQKRRLKIVSGH